MQQQPHGCCSSSAKDSSSLQDVAAEAARFGLPDPSELEDDPVLADCCAEDLRNMRQAERLRQALLEVDRSTARLRLHQQAQPQQPPLQPADEEPGGSDLDSDFGSEGDPELEELRRKRLAEMQRQAAERQQQAVQGFGTLSDLQPGHLLGRVEELGGAVVAHLAVAGCEAGAQLDEHLSVLAHRHRGTFFCRVALKRGDTLQRRLGMDTLPGLVCFRSGAVVGRAPVSQFGPPGCIVEEEVTSYLRRLRVLRDARGEGGGAGGRGGSKGGAAATNSDEDDGEDSDQDEWRVKPCELCGRRYPHEHVRAVYGGRGGVSGGSPDADD